MNIAVICPIGDLNRFGYSRIAQPCLGSWRGLGDLYLIHSSRTATPFSIKANHIRYDKTLMKVVNGAEWFDHHLVASNANIGLEQARQAGYDMAITICVNWYVEEIARHEVYKQCCDMLEHRSPCGFLYRRIQIGPRLFDADRMSIAVFNLHYASGDIVKVLVDEADIDGITITSARGHFDAMNDAAYVDCEYELTTAELQAKLADVRNYEDILPKRHGADWEYWQKYYQKRAAELTASPDAPGTIGQQISAAHPHGAFGDWLIEQMAATA